MSRPDFLTPDPTPQRAIDVRMAEARGELDTFIRIPAYRARDTDAVMRAVQAVAAELGLRYVDKTTRRIGHVVVLGDAR